MTDDTITVCSHCHRRFVEISNPAAPGGAWLFCTICDRGAPSDDLEDLTTPS